MVYKPPEASAILKDRLTPVNMNQETQDGLSFLDRIAVKVTNGVGTPQFFLAVLIWTAGWLLWNFLAPDELKFDPPMGFILWLFLSNMIQILLMPLVMLGQNIQGRHAEWHAEHDLQVDLRSEVEIAVLLQHQDYQNNLLERILRMLDSHSQP